MKRITWEKCGGYRGEYMCDSYDPYKPDSKPDYATFKNIRTGKYYCASCLFECKEFDKKLNETLRTYHK